MQTDNTCARIRLEEAATDGLFVQRQFVYGVRLRANLLITLRGFYD